jgi:glycosyltransferase involved in cell wall biosynthesis
MPTREMTAPLADGQRRGHGVAAPIRICFLIDDLALAGTETQLLALIRGLDRSRFRPYLCLLRGANTQSRRLEPMDCPVWRLGVGALARPSAIRAALRFAQFLRLERIDVLQVYFPDSTYFGIPIAWLAGVPSRVRTRNNVGHFLTRLQCYLGRLLNGLTTSTIANCAAAKAALLDQERAPAERVFVLENGVDVDRFAGVAPLRLKKATELRTIGAVANLRPVKGIDLLIDAAYRLTGSFPNLRFRVAGDGPDRSALERGIRQRGLVSKFELLGSVRDIPAFLGETDVAVLCSRAEGMPNCLLEYMAAGRPIVATDVGAVNGLISNEVHGLVVPAGDAAALASGIERLIEGPRLAQMMAEAARRRASDQYSRQAMIRRFELFYEQIARRPATQTAPFRGGR